MEFIRSSIGLPSNKVSLLLTTPLNFSYRQPFSQRMVDLVRSNSNGKVALMKEFFDSGHIHGHFEEHEKQVK